MTEEMLMGLGAETLRTTLYLAGPLLIAAMLIGIVVSVLQAITQINEATLTFIPKMVAVVLVLIVMAPWMLEILQNYANNILGNAGDWIR